MSAFTDLLREAETLGATKLTWDCDLRDYASDERRANRWTCRASLRDATLTTVDCTGRTGEEALREIVAFLKAVA